MKKIGLVLEGGGMRGVYTAGVLDAFIMAGLEFDGIIGVSAGSCHAASFLSKQKERAYRVNTAYLKDWRYCSVRSLIATGDFFGAKMLYDIIPNQLDPYDFDTFNQRKGWFRAVVTNVDSGEAEYPELTNMHNDVKILQASSSLPLLSRLVSLNGKNYLDGGISDSIPVEASMRYGCEKNIIILTQSAEYRKKPNSLMPIMKLKYKCYPKMLEKIQNRHIAYNATLDRIEQLKQENKVFVIQPKNTVEIGRLEKSPKKLEALYLQGVEDGNSYIEAIKTWMMEK